MWNVYTERERPLKSGEHEHRCAWCKTCWRHGDENRGNEEAHRCPECGRVTLYRVTEGYYGSG